MSWNEHDHRRNPDGTFTDMAIARWAKEMGDWADRSADSNLIRGLVRSNAFHPEGHTEAVAEHRRLWSIPESVAQGGLGRDRTDAEHDEAVRLDEAFEAYREALGLHRNPKDRGLENTFLHGEGSRLFNSYGERLNGKYMSQYSDSMQHKDRLVTGRRGEQRSRRGYSSDRAVTQRYPDTGDSVTREGEFGYGARADLHDEEGLERAKAFVALMKRQRARARMEQPKAKKRRTPRGTQVDGWMNQVNARIAQTHGGAR